MADLNDLNLKRLAEKPIEFTLVYPKDFPEEGQDIEQDGELFTWSVYGKDSEVYKNADIAEARLQADKGLKNVVDKVLESRDGSVRIAAACTGVGRIYLDGQWTDVDKSNALSILKDHEWIAEQCNAVIHDRAKMLENAKKK